MDEKPVLCWEVVVNRRKLGGDPYDTEKFTYPYYGCTEREAYKKANLRRGTNHVIEVRSMPPDEFFACYGSAGRKYG